MLDAEEDDRTRLQQDALSAVQCDVQRRVAERDAARADAAAAQRRATAAENALVEENGVSAAAAEECAALQKRTGELAAKAEERAQLRAEMVRLQRQLAETEERAAAAHTASCGQSCNSDVVSHLHSDDLWQRHESAALTEHLATAQRELASVRRDHANALVRTAGQQTSFGTL